MKALVTGADGFIGSRLVERLGERHVSVRALVRRGIVTAQRSDARVERIRGDVTCPESLDAAARGCTLIYHCAHGGETFDEQWEVNVAGTRNVLEAGARAGARRVVHLSSLAVHGRRLPEVLTEDFPLVEAGDAYAVTKAAGERLAFELGTDLGVEVVALRPTLVYGPRAPLWLLAYFERVRREQLYLIDGGAGLANLVHVDDLVRAMIAAGDAGEVDGEAFLMNGDRAITWREYLGYFAGMCGKPLPRSRRAWRASIDLPLSKILSMLAQRSSKILKMDLDLMTQRCSVSIEKARRYFDYEPQMSIEAGMRECEAWLRQAGYLPPASDLRQGAAGTNGAR